MKNFQLLEVGIDTIPALHQLQLNDQLWNQHQLRTTHEGSAHKESSDIWLRFQDLAGYRTKKKPWTQILDDTRIISYPAWNELQTCQQLVLGLMSRVRGLALGRVLITKLPPGGGIAPHADEGEYAKIYQRYHIALQGLPGVAFTCGQEDDEEQVSMLTGQCWWFNNKKVHYVLNNSAEDRIHLIADIEV